MKVVNRDDPNERISDEKVYGEHIGGIDTREPSRIEIRNAMKAMSFVIFQAMKNDKAPGIDSITAELRNLRPIWLYN